MKSKELILKKISKDWYRIPVTIDKWGITIVFVDILRNKYNEWSVCDDESEIGLKASDLRRYEFNKLRSAKAFAKDLAAAIKNETPFPRKCDDKYLELEI